MSDSSSLIFSEIDLDAEGKHQGFLHLPHSVHRSAYGWLPIPVASIKNGDGPVVLLMAGNHGDEYEGQVALCRLIKELDVKQIKGQIILLPMANFPAAKAGLRTSPIDDGNLNRSFPGDPYGTPTQMIAHFIETELLERSDYLLDIHSGGSSLLYIPSLLMVIDGDPEQHKKDLALLRSLKFPQILLFPSSNMDCYSSSAAKRKGCIAITAEVAGGGTIDKEALSLLEHGLNQYLVHVGVTSLTSYQQPNLSSVSPEVFQIVDQKSYCHATERGVFEPLVKLGDIVETGQIAALIHDPETPWNQPTKIEFDTSGKIVCKRIPARVERGDCLFEVGSHLE